MKKKPGSMPLTRKKSRKWPPPARALRLFLMSTMLLSMRSASKIPSSNPQAWTNDLVVETKFPMDLDKLTLFPRVNETCRVRFLKNNMAFCPTSEIALQVVLRLLQYAFGCSTDHLPLHPATTDKKCLFVQTSGDDETTKASFASQDMVVWGAFQTKDTNSSHPASVLLLRGPISEHSIKKNANNQTTMMNTRITYGDPAFLVPFLFKEFNQMPTVRKTYPSRFCIVVNDRMVESREEVMAWLQRKESLLVIEWDASKEFKAMWNQAQYCDYIATHVPEGLILADSLGIPTAILHHDLLPVDWDGIEDYERAGFRNRSTIISREIRLFKPSKYTGERPSLLPPNYRVPSGHATRLLESFPFHLFSTTTVINEDETPSSLQSQQQNKTLVIVMGNLRGGESAWESLYRHVLDVNSADLALIIGQDPSTNKTSMFQRAKYLWEFPEYDDWADALDTIQNSTDWRKNILPQVTMTTGLFGGVNDRAGSGAIIFMIRHWLRQHIIRLNLTELYDRFVVTRSDFFYKCNHDLDALDRRYLWVPEGEDYGGISDRHLVCGSEHVLRAINILEPLLEHHERYFALHLHANPEQLIMMRWKAERIFPHQVRRFPRMMYTSSVDGDETRWRNKRRYNRNGAGQDGCVVKYPKEFGFAKCKCHEGSTIRDMSTNRVISTSLIPTNEDFSNAWQRFTCTAPGESRLTEATDSKRQP